MEVQEKEDSLFGYIVLKGTVMVMALDLDSDPVLVQSCAACVIDRLHSQQWSQTIMELKQFHLLMAL